MKTTTIRLGDSPILTKCWVAKSFWSRLWGLIPQKSLNDDQAILFTKCNSVHTFFMRLTIDVVFISQKGVVVDVVQKLAPWRCVFPRFNAAHVLELGAGRCAAIGIMPGTALSWGNE